MQTQQADVYAAEQGLSQGTTWTLLEAAEAQVLALRDRPWWPQVVLDVQISRKRLRSGVAAAGAFDRGTRTGVIYVAPGTVLTDATLVHELAHVLGQAVHTSKSHDPWWARVHLELTYEMRGSAAYVELWDAYQRRGIDADAPGLKFSADNG